MLRIRWLAVALVLVVGLGIANPASAGPLKDWFCHGDCPPPDYSPFRYWVPWVARCFDKKHGPHLSVYAPDRHPEIPPTYAILTFRCPAVPPEATLIPVPTPPNLSTSASTTPAASIGPALPAAPGK
jgi:hypothetical protein